MNILKTLQKYLLLGISLCLVACAPTASTNNSVDQQSIHAISASLPDSLLSFTGDKQLVLGELDYLQRSTVTHIQLRYQDKPTQQREPKINANPIGWHNYKFAIDESGKEAWLMNRGHLVGYQFSGLNDELRNLAPMTAYLNTGSSSGTDETNPEGVLFYEEKLARWLKDHPTYWLDYQVKPIYLDEELIPRQVELQYAGISDKGELISIKFQTDFEQAQEDGTTRVVLNNQSSNANIDYRTGTAEATIGNSTTTQQLRQKVYVANQGKSKVYWYDRTKMPEKTNQANVVEMSETEAIAQGKTHTNHE